MADGDYERHAARDAELRRMERIIRETRASCAGGADCGKIYAPVKTRNAAQAEN